MKAEIINIGDELLIGQVVNTNAAWMAEQSSLAGFSVVQVTMIRDDREHILQALADAEKRASVILISGGIGPTRDDITKHTLCEYFDTRLVFSKEAYHDIEALFARRGYPVTELNRQQAELPESCLQIPNRLGTARGMWFEKQGKSGQKVVAISMPGVPFEMKAMMSEWVIPRLREVFSPLYIRHRTVLTQGVGESFLAAEISDWEDALPPYIKLAYLPQPGIVRLRLTGTGTEEKLIDDAIQEHLERLVKRIPQYIFGYDDDTLEKVAGDLLRRQGMTLSAAESCTGGYIAHLITSVPGSSDYFRGSVVAYANQAKTALLGISEELINHHGAVSEAVVSQMASAVRQRFGSDFSIATSGIAGPGGGTESKPVGTTWIAVATPHTVKTKKFLFGDNRERNIRRAALAALNMLRNEIVPDA